jgi:hypothetical protein
VKAKKKDKENYIFMNFICKDKGKAIPLQALAGP